MIYRQTIFTTFAASYILFRHEFVYIYYIYVRIRNKNIESKK